MRDELHQVFARRLRVALLLAVAGCGDEPPRGQPFVPPPAPVEPPRIELGDCARVTDELVSGQAPPVEYVGGSGGGGGESIGPGALGTLGHGAGTGSAPGPRGTPPTTRIVSLDVDARDAETWRAITRRYVKRNIMKLQYCYEKQLAIVNAPLAGKLVLGFGVAADGKVATTEVRETLHPDIGTCATDVLRTVEIPKPADGPFKAVLTLEFAKPPSFDGSAVRDVSAVNAPNPLASRLAELTSCLQKQPAVSAGAVDLIFGANETVANATVQGTVAPCVQEAARGARNTSTAGRMRCPFAVGSLPASEVETLEVRTAQQLRWRGSLIARDAVRGVIRSLVKTVQTGAAPLVQRGPLVLEPALAVPMAEIDELVAVARDENMDVVFIVPNAFGGKRFLGRTLPLLPERSGRAPRWGKAPEHVVHVRADGVDLDREPVRSWDQLIARLASLRASSGPALRIAYERNAPFGQVAHVVDLAYGAGFTGWTF